MKFGMKMFLLLVVMAGVCIKSANGQSAFLSFAWSLYKIGKAIIFPIYEGALWKFGHDTFESFSSYFKGKGGGGGEGESERETSESETGFIIVHNFAPELFSDIETLFQKVLIRETKSFVDALYETFQNEAIHKIKSGIIKFVITKSYFMF